MIFDKPGHILLVDDNLAVLETTREFLVMAGFKVTCCGDSTKALDLMGEVEPDLLITDVRMPQMSGTDLIQTMRRFSVEIPVIIITGYAEQDMLIESIRMNVFDVIKKPFNYKYLSESAAKAISHRRQLLQLHKLATEAENNKHDVPVKEIGRLAADLVKMLNQLKGIEDRHLENRHLDPARAQADRLVWAVQRLADGQ